MTAPQLPKTKIVCTIGPASAFRETLCEMARAGMSVARINFSHGTQEFNAHLMKLIREAAEDAEREVAILQDLQGVKVRVGKIAGGKAILLPGHEVVLIPGESTDREGVIPVPLANLAELLRPGDVVTLRDGQVKLEITATLAEGSGFRARVVWGGEITSHSGFRFQGAHPLHSFFTEKDKNDLLFGLENGVDMVALSYVRGADDIVALNSFLQSHGRTVPVIAKIEHEEALQRYAEILEVADGIMIARGDLGVEIPLERIPMVQKQLIQSARVGGKPVITATQMLDSMIMNPQPTRAEVTDVANAILDGTDAVMLSAETAIGKHPLRAVQMLAAIAREVEEVLEPRRDPSVLRDSQTDAISRAAVDIAHQLGARAILAPTSSGHTARMIARFRPRIPILACSQRPEVRQFLSIVWGVTPLAIPESESTEKTIEDSVNAGLAAGRLEYGDLVVITAGVPSGVAGTTNLLRIHRIAEVLARGKPHRATGWLSGTIGTDILVMDRFPEAALPETVRALLIRAKSLYDAPVVPDLPFLFALKEWSPLTDGDQVTINLDIGLVYRGILRT
jgi:pyruvate kinase